MSCSTRAGCLGAVLSSTWVWLMAAGERHTMRSFLLASLLAACRGHGAVTFPPPRNAIDSDDAKAQSNATYPYRGQACPMPDGGDGKTSGANGQACYWFSNGASIGCPTPDATTRGPIPKTPCGPRAKKVDGMCRRKMDTCGLGYNATICDPHLRTVNTAAECGGPDDWYYYSPWRAPGWSARAIWKKKVSRVFIMAIVVLTP